MSLRSMVSKAGMLLAVLLLAGCATGYGGYPGSGSPSGYPGGYALLLEHAGDLQDTDETVFDSLLDVLEETATAWRARGVPFWVFLAMPMAFFDELDADGDDQGA